MQSQFPQMCLPAMLQVSHILPIRYLPTQKLMMNKGGERQEALYPLCNKMPSELLPIGRYRWVKFHLFSKCLKECSSILFMFPKSLWPLHSLFSKHCCGNVFYLVTNWIACITEVVPKSLKFNSGNVSSSSSRYLPYNFSRVVPCVRLSIGTVIHPPFLTPELARRFLLCFTQFSAIVGSKFIFSANSSRNFFLVSASFQYPVLLLVLRGQASRIISTIKQC